MAINVQPLQNFILVKPGKKEEMRSGIVIPDTAQEKAQEGQVVAAGPGRLGKDNTREVMDVKVGDYVIYPKFGGTEIKVEGVEMIIMPENQVLAKKIY
ncbi:MULTISPECIES: co-chaperone GroES [Dehalogenimonas]|jgi:chaperonin GroES|uniref:Co-chaperonin GroES n=2 Tax=Dehalogenimonas TaxID=670486 RepID=A0A0W0GGA2_9CHLR|nr:co-chaperone GroES [Dehalogenimonas alkenigignens]KTB47591.1 Co-chaperonin GroES (HSP10) [Dehalogenimonas alkenigignens]PVV82867.1 co-chaperone GroES [Dehalogenimonas alkenigignens]